MKLKELFEAPQLVKKELDKALMRPFYSENTLKREFEFIAKDKTPDNEEYWVILRKNRSGADIGFPGHRGETPGMTIFSTVEFKSKVTFSGIKDIPTTKDHLQVNLVVTAPVFRAGGWGFRLYTHLADAGYTIVSDNTQYLGGQALWKKIAKETLSSKYKVYVFDHGELRVNEDGEPVIYDSKNIDDSELWSENTDRKYTLFALQAT